MWSRRRRELITWAFVVSLASLASAADFHVATDGDDTADGSSATPWRTIQRAADSVPPGSTVHIHSGSYAERVSIRVSGSEQAGFTTFRPFEEDDVRIDGSTLVAPTDDDSSLLEIVDQSYVRIQGLEFRHYETGQGDIAVVGVLVLATAAGSAHHIELIDNEIHHIENTNRKTGGNAHGIAVFGENGTIALTDLVVEGNTVRNCTLGNSEALVLNGNVDGFRVVGNTVHDNNNIGIDLIGFEGTAPENDQVRNGLVADNTVFDCSSFGNPAYGKDYSAAGIYVDGGRDIIIERNWVSECDFGIEVASENAGRATSDIRVRDNLLIYNNTAGIAVGGEKDSRRRKHGTAVRCTFEHNTLFENDRTRDGTGELLIQRANDIVFRHNIIAANRQRLLFSSDLKSHETFDIRFGRNLWHAGHALIGKPTAPQQVRFTWRGRRRKGFDALADLDLDDGTSTFAVPQFDGANPEDRTFTVFSSSPAVDAGDPDFVAGFGETGFTRSARVKNGRVDLGAFEGAGSSDSEPEPSMPAVDAEGEVGNLLRVELIPTGRLPMTFEVTEGALPPGVVLHQFPPRLAGVPTETGVFVAEVEATNALDSSSADVHIEIFPPGPRDRDEDGFPDDVEDAFGPGLRDDPDDGPLGPGAPPSLPLDVTKLKLKLNFKKADRDRFTLHAELGTLADGFENGEIAFSIGGFIRRIPLDFFLDDSVPGLKKLRIEHRPDGSATLTVVMKNIRLGELLTDEGLVNATVRGERVTVPVLVVLGGRLYVAGAPLDYRSKGGASGSGKGPSAD